MSIKPGVRAGYDFPSLTLLQSGLGALQEYERIFLAKLFVKEVRKGSFQHAAQGTDDDVLKSFAEHVQKNFADSEELKTVIDFQPRLLYSARSLARRPHPIEAVILYATWMEHWLNAILLTTALKQGRPEADAVQMVREIGIRGKLGWLWSMLRLPAITATDTDRIAFLAEVRNEHVHYKWKGQDPDVLFGETSRLSVAINDIEETVRSLVESECSSVIGDEIVYANRLFQVELGAIVRRDALEWKPPEDDAAWHDA